MILAVEDLMEMSEFSELSETELKQKLDAVEQLIRAYTNNSFQNRFVRFRAPSEGYQVLGTSPYLEAGDTVQISQSKVNDGLYTVAEVGDEAVTLDRELFTVDWNLVTKVEYPADIAAGVLNLMIWEVNNRQKVGIKAETLSRHSVTYYDQDSSNQVMGYPVALLGFLKPYCKARF
ncbi:MAG: hypothetical protein LUD82_08665 [Clostridiales bacterium]|nr:hypothetical protein [Clostridiales bacterium]